MSPKELKARYEKGENIAAVLRNEAGLKHNTEKIIEISYDLQAGAYVSAMEQEDYKLQKQEYSYEIAKLLKSLGTDSTSSVLEAGVGEATTFSGVLQNLAQGQVRAYGFDLSWSRIAIARNWLAREGIPAPVLCTGSLLNIPFADNSIDVVYTSHSIEPNGGMEVPILKELYRVSKKFLVLLEPAYELATMDARNRMDSHGYCKNLAGVSKQLGFNVVEHRLFYVANPMNPTALTVIQKEEVAKTPISSRPFACPMYKTPLQDLGGGGLFSPEALVVYPVIAGIPCLRVENGIVASYFPEILESMQLQSGRKPNI